MKTQPIIDLQNPPAGAIPATEEQLTALGVTPAEIAAGEKRFDMIHAGPWQICTSLAAVVECKDYQEGPHGLTKTARARFWPVRRMSRPKESGYQMEGTVSIAGRKIPAFTSSQLFELPDGRLVDVATLHLCHRTPSGNRNLAAL